MKKSSLIILLLLALSLVLLYRVSFHNFFFQDDFFNMKLAQKHSVVDAFNIFKKPIMDFYFYRPFSTELYWFVSRLLFGFSPLGYHIVNFVFFLAAIFLVYTIAKHLFGREKPALLASFFYAYSGSHFYRLFFLSQFQEISLAVFTFAALFLFLKKSRWTILFFILALTTKETAVMLVPLMLVFVFFSKDSRRQYFILFAQCAGVGAVYLFARFFFFGFAKGGVYTYDFSPKKVLNNYFWYSLWSLGFPEAFVNIKLFTFPTIINPQLFTKFESWGNPTLASFALFICAIFVPMVTLLKKGERKVVFALIWFILFLLPVAFFPFHKFPYSVTVPLLGSSLVLAYATYRLSNKKLVLIGVVYGVLAIVVYQFNLSNHWMVKKAASARAVFNYFQSRPSQKRAQSAIYFRSTMAPLCVGPAYGPAFSQEIAYAIGESDGLRLLYNDPKLAVYFEDFDHLIHLRTNFLILDSQTFFR